MKPIKLYQILTERQMKSFLKDLGTSIENEKLVEIKSEKDDLFGDFIVTNGYKFKKVYGEYQCMKTPTETHSKAKLNFPKAANDYYKKR